MAMHRRDVLKTVCVAAVLHGVFTIGLPWWLLKITHDQQWALMRLGPARWLGLVGPAFGVYLYSWALLRLVGRRTSAIPGHKPAALETSGWYARVRHPLLLGVVLILTGEAVVFQSIVLLGYALAYWAGLNAFVQLREEPDLHATFGEAYAHYCRHVPRWVPHMGHARLHADRHGRG